MKKIEEAISQSEQRHAGEIVFIVEGALPFSHIFGNSTPRDRAIELFSEHRVWDTAHNSGVLIYLLLSERDIEIVADRGVLSAVSDKDFAEMITTIERHSKKGAFAEGIVKTVQSLTEKLALIAPKGTADKNEIGNQPIRL